MTCLIQIKVSIHIKIPLVGLYASKKVTMSRHYVAFKVSAKDAGTVVTEHLRYAGLISVENWSHPSHGLPLEIEKALDRQEGEVIIIMECPHGLNAQVWSQQNVDRLASFNVKAYQYKI